MKTLIELIGQSGFDKVQTDQFPIDIMPGNGMTYERMKREFFTSEHNYDLYAHNGVIGIVQDNRNIVELSGIRKTGSRFQRTATVTDSDMLVVDDARNFFKGFQNLFSYKSECAFGLDPGMDFQSMGQRIELAGQLYRR